MNARDHSGMSGQPRHETMFPSTTSGASTTVAPAFSMSPVSGGNAAVVRPRRRPYTAGTCGPWQIVPTGRSFSKKYSVIRRTSGVGADVLGSATAGDDERRVALDLDLGEREVDRKLAAVLLGVGVGVRIEVVDHELDVAPAQSGDVDVPAGLPDPIQRVHHVELLGSVTGEHQGAWHVLLLSRG